MKRGYRCWCLVAALTALWTGASNAQNQIPNRVDLAGGARVIWPPDLRTDLPRRSKTGSIDGVVVFGYELLYSTDEGLEVFRFEGIAPPQPVPGLVEILIEWSGVPPLPDPIIWEDGLIYVDTPVLTGASPLAHSYLFDDRVCTITGEGFPVARGAEVWFGDQQATNVKVNAHGTELTCLPPPFPEGATYPLEVPLRVKTVGGGEVLYEEPFTYKQIVPVFDAADIVRPRVPSWRTGTLVTIGGEHFLPADVVKVYLDDLEVPAYHGNPPAGNQPLIYFFTPSHKPDLVDITVVNPDGGSYTAPGAFLFYRVSPYHTADLNENGVLSLSELLRIVQFYNGGGYSCTSGTEDGFLMGQGATDCIPHDSDLLVQDWTVDFSELLEAIQLYNWQG